MTASVVCYKKKTEGRITGCWGKCKIRNFKIPSSVIRVFNGHSFPGSKAADGVKTTPPPRIRVDVWNYTSISSYFFTARSLIKHIYFTCFLFSARLE